jgi:phosphoglycolate phosphatase
MAKSHPFASLLAEATSTDMFKNLIFDWSGTLVDDMGPTLEATNAVFVRHGKAPLKREEFRRLFRLPYGEFYEEHLPGVPLGDLENHFRQAFAESTVPVTVLPHAREKLEWCHERKIRCFVLTSMDRATFEKQLDELELQRFFEATYSGVLDKRSVIGQVLSNHSLAAAETAFLGDMVHDVMTAKHGGVSSVALLTGYTHHDVLAAAEPDWMVEDLLAMRIMMNDYNRPDHE